MNCLLCEKEDASCYVLIKGKYFCEECLKSTYLYKNQKQTEAHLDSKMQELGKKCDRIEDVYNAVKKLKTPIKTKKINLFSKNRETKKKRFLDEIVNICKCYDLSLSHQDGHGSFLVTPYNESYSNWLGNAEWEDA